MHDTRMSQKINIDSYHKFILYTIQILNINAI